MAGTVPARGDETRQRRLNEYMSEVRVRPMRPGDGSGCARAWLDAGRYYAQLAPEEFQIPAEEGLPEWFEQLHANASDNCLQLVGCVNAEVVGFVSAVLEPPVADAYRQLVRHVTHPRVFVGALAVAQRYRRAGVGTALMRKVEGWAREHGAVLVSLDTNLHSPLSVPFYEDRLDYTRAAVIFRKSLR
jgi:GNAT superfamily N-acetyltransferase